MEVGRPKYWFYFCVWAGFKRLYYAHNRNLPIKEEDVRIWSLMGLMSLIGTKINNIDENYEITLLKLIDYLLIVLFINCYFFAVIVKYKNYLNEIDTMVWANYKKQEVKH